MENLMWTSNRCPIVMLKPQVHLELFKTYCDYSTYMQYGIPNDAKTVMCVWSKYGATRMEVDVDGSFSYAESQNDAKGNFFF